MRGIRSAVCAGAVTVVTMGSTLAAAPALGAGAPHYVALGDSYSSGVGTRDYVSDSGSCLRSTKAYPQLWANVHHAAEFTFAACSGAKTDDVVAKQLGSLDSGTTLVTISVGGNDVGFVEVIARCLLSDDAGCDNAVSSAETKVRDELPGKLASTYAKIRSAAPRAKVVVVGYPRLNTLGSCAIPGYDDAKRARINAGADRLDSVLSSKATAAGFSFADPRRTFDGHGVCSEHEWINGPSNPLQESFHPNVDGHSQGYLPTVDAVTG